MLNVILMAGSVGGALTFAALLRFGVLVALVGAPLGGSLLALAAALWRYSQDMSADTPILKSRPAPYGGGRNSQLDP